LSDVITAILAMRIVVQFMAQSVGVVLLRKKFGSRELPFKMWLYPVPVIITLLIWLFLLYNNEYALWGGLFAVAGVGVYYLKKKFFEKAEQRTEP
ncbi:MAG: hypothetical protein JNJ86_15985, partial [Chitinophagaceae bacterium]|nr:hypothetical protein [Chitinophagaceae bacterium]